MDKLVVLRFLFGFCKDFAFHKATERLSKKELERERERERVGIRAFNIKILIHTSRGNQIVISTEFNSVLGERESERERNLRW